MIVRGDEFQDVEVPGSGAMRVHLIRPAVPRWREAPRGNEIWYASRLAGDVEMLLWRRRPGLLFVHIPDPDVAGHVHGWMSAPYRMAVRRADGAVGRVVRAAERAFGGDGVVIVTSDHGELFGEDRFFGHGPVCHEKVLEVPFVEGMVP